MISDHLILAIGRFSAVRSMTYERNDPTNITFNDIFWLDIFWLVFATLLPFTNQYKHILVPRFDKPCLLYLVSITIRFYR